MRTSHPIRALAKHTFSNTIYAFYKVSNEMRTLHPIRDLSKSTFSSTINNCYARFTRSRCECILRDQADRMLSNNLIRGLPAQIRVCGSHGDANNNTSSIQNYRRFVMTGCNPKGTQALQRALSLSPIARYVAAHLSVVVFLTASQLFINM